MRLRAVKALTRQTILAAVARGDSSLEVRLAAAERLADRELAQGVYVELVRGSAWNRNVGLVAAARLRDEGLARTAVAEMIHECMEAPPEMFLEWLGRATDQGWLARIAGSAGHEATRRAALEGITDEAALLEVARSSRDRAIARTALARMVGETALLDLASTSTSCEIAVAAAERLTSPAAFTSLARNAVDKGARLVAVERLTDEASLARLAAQDCAWTVRAAALARVHDQELLAEIGIGAAHSDARAAAVRRLCGEERVLAAARHASAFEDRLAVAEKLVELGWSARKVGERVCSRCNGTGVVWVNTDAAFERDVSSYECGCGPRDYSLTFSCEKAGQPSFEITCTREEVARARRDGTEIPPWLA